MKKSLLTFTAMGALLACAWFPPASQALPAQRYEMEYTQGRPLMVIRFNQRSVYFEKQLYNTVSRALQAKSTVMFDLVAVAPARGDARQQAALKATNAQNGGKVVKVLRDMGVPQSRMTYSQTVDPSLDFGEVRLFVR